METIRGAISRTASSQQQQQPPPEVTPLHSSIGEQTPMSMSPVQSIVCRQCRARKVKCDRIEPCCGPCSRLHLTCSPGTNNRGQNLGGTRTDLTQAGTKRKRARQACQPCQLVKAKCSGWNPCERCCRKSLNCNLERHDEGSREPVTENDDSLTGGHPIVPNTPETDGFSSIGCFLPYQKKEIKGYIDAYFHLARKSGLSFLHKPTILAKWSNMTIDQSLLKVVVAIGAYVSESAVDPESAASNARRHIQEAQDVALRHIGRQSIAQLSLLVLLLRFRFDTGDSSEAWNLLAVAARIVFTMRLNHEREGLDAVSQETIRRFVWTVYEIDRICSGGIDYLTVCPADRMHIRLPCDDSSFEMGLRSTTGRLTDPITTDSPALSADSYRLKLHAIRHNILGYTKRVRRSDADLSSSRSELEALQRDLDMFEKQLPEEMKLNARRLGLMVHSSEGAKCIQLHTIWLICHCDLYRHTIAGIRESATQEALSRTPVAFIDSCHRACLEAAVRLCDSWSELYQLETGELIGGGATAVAIYQVAQILNHLPPHLLNSEIEGVVAGISDGRRSTRTILKDKLFEALEIASLKETTIFCTWTKCVQDARRLVQALNSTHPLTSAAASCILSLSRGDSEDEVDKQDHLQSRHHMLAGIERDSVLDDTTIKDDRRGGHTVERMRPGLVQTQLDAQDETLSSQLEGNNGYRMPLTTYVPRDPVGSDLSGETFVAHYDLGEIPFWDPLDLDLNSYY